MNDLKFAIRQLLKNPGFTAMAVLTLALGIGANTAVFSILNAVLIRPLPFPEPNRLVWVFQNKPQREWLQWPMGTHKFKFWQEHSRSFEQLAFAGPVDFQLKTGGATEIIRGLKVTANLCKLLGIQPALGRAFRSEENLPGAERVAILSHRFWQRHFSGDPQVIGRTLRQGGLSYTVVGVLPERLKFPLGPMPAWRVLSSGDPEIWLPAVLRQPGEPEGDLGFVLGRLKLGVSLEAAQAEMHAVTEQHEQVYPKVEGWSADVVPMREQVSGHVRPTLLLLLGAVGAVLLIACVNVANLLLARSLDRQKEFAVRTALGAGRWHLIRQLLTEGVLLSLLGGATGIFLAFGMAQGLLALSSVPLPRMDEIGIDARVLAFTAGLSILAGLAVGLLPLRRASRVGPILLSSVKGSLAPRESSVFRTALIAGQVTVSLGLLIAAGLLIRSFALVLKVETGYDSERVLVMNLALNTPAHPTSESQNVLVKELLDRIENLPGVAAAGFSFGLPLAKGVPINKPLQADGRSVPPGEDPYVNVRIRIVSSNYFSTLGIPLLRGQGFSPGVWAPDAEIAEVILNESAARKLFPGEDPLGKQCNFGPIIGVVADTRDVGLDKAPEPQFFIEGYSAAEAFLVVRTTQAAGPALQKAVAQEIAALDKDLPVVNITTLERMVSDSLGPRRFQMSVLAVFAVSALGLTAIGVFGVVARSVTQRTSEIGLRAALGATRTALVFMVIRDAMKPVVLGMVLGWLGALATTQLLAHHLFGVSATDPRTFLSVALILAITALAACWLPARRAARIEPMEALRYDG